jgi:hypothetical protein
MASEEKVREIKPEELKRLLEKATPAETKFLLFLSRSVRPGTSFYEREDFEVIYGHVEEVKIAWHYNYPHDDSSEYLIIPKTVPTIIRWWHRWDFGNDRGYKEAVFIFTPDGWKEVEVKNSRR